MVAQAVTSEKLKHFQVKNWPLSLPEQNGLQDAVHAPDLAERDRYILALVDSKYPALQNLARRMASCADSVHLYVDSTAFTVREYLHRCKARLCPLCARSRSLHVASQVESQVRLMEVPRHLVLTVKSTTKGLALQLAELRKWFRQLRRTPFWKSHVLRGVYTVEITINERTGLWHPHLHCVFEGEYLPYKVLRQAWHTITGGSEIVWIEMVDNAQGMAREICKYIGKPQKSEAWTGEQIRDYAHSVHGQRMIQSFGAPVAKPTVDSDQNPAVTDADWSLSLAKVLWLADMCQESAYRALPLIAERWPHLGRYIYQRMPQLEPELTKAERILSVMSIIETGRAPPRHAAGPRRESSIIEAELVTHLQVLHDLDESILF